jgi:hypothetical protein
LSLRRNGKTNNALKNGSEDGDVSTSRLFDATAKAVLTSTFDGELQGALDFLSAFYNRARRFRVRGFASARFDFSWVGASRKSDAFSRRRFVG